MTLDEIIAYFKSFKLELLTSTPQTETEIQDFSCKIRGNTLEQYLKTEAWKDDLNGETRIYIIREPQSNRIVLFFSLKCGLVFTTSPLDDEYRKLSSHEKEFVRSLLVARREKDDKKYYTLIENGKKVFDQLALMQEIAEKRLAVKNELDQLKESQNILMVDKCFSSIEMKHFCRSDEFQIDDRIYYPLGFGLFWEKIVPTIIEIAKGIGCEYLYLFAADRSDNQDDKRLITYYKDSLGFRDINDEGVIIIKPEYDENCVGLLQSISALSNARKFAWESFSDVIRAND